MTWVGRCHRRSTGLDTEQVKTDYNFPSFTSEILPFSCVSFAVFTQYLYHSSRWPYVSPMNAIGCLFWRRRPSCVCSGGEEGGEGVNWRLRVRFLRNEFLLRLWCPSYKHSSHISANYWHSLHTHTHTCTHTHTSLSLTILLFFFSSVWTPWSSNAQAEPTL